MQVRGKRVLKNGAIAGYVKQRDGTWKWRFIGGDTNAQKTVDKYLKKENKKLSANEKKSKSARIKAKLSTLHNTGFFNTYYSKILRRYERANEKAEKGNFKNLDDIIKELSEHKEKKYEKAKKNSKRFGRGQYLQSVILEIEANKKNKKIKKIRNKINNSQFSPHLGNKNKESEKRVNFIYKLEKKELPIPTNESQFYSASIWVDENGNSIYNIEQWEDFLKLKVPQILNELYNFYMNLSKKINLGEKNGANELVPISIVTLNEIKKKNPDIYKNIEKISNKLYNIKNSGGLGYSMTIIDSTLFHLNHNANQKTLNENKNKISIELKDYIIDFIQNFDIDLFLQIPDKEIKEFFEKKQEENNNN